MAHPQQFFRPPPTLEPLRGYLRMYCGPSVIRRVAAADRGVGAVAIEGEFRRNLTTGEYGWAEKGGGNPYECCVLQLYLDAREVEPLEMLFGAWWIAAYCSQAERWVLIANIGVARVLQSVVFSSAQLGPDAARAAMPLVAFLKARDPQPIDALYVGATRAMEAAMKLGFRREESGRYQEFMRQAEEVGRTGGVRLA